MKFRQVALALWLLGCSGQRSGPGSGAAPLASHGVETPLRPDAALALPPSDTAAAEVSLEAFSPLLAEALLKPAADALEKDNPRLAAHHVKEALEKHPPSASDAPRWYFLLARLEEQAGSWPAASAAYERAAAQDWPLTGYARLGAARTLVRSGANARALAILRSVPLDQPLAVEARLLTAESAARLGDFSRAIEAWRGHLASGEQPVDAANVSLRLAEALVARARAGAAPLEAKQRQEELLEALHLARKVRLEHVAARELALRAEAVEVQILASLPPDLRSAHARITPEEELGHVRGLVDAGLYTPAVAAGAALQQRLPAPERWGRVGCEAAYLQYKALGSNRTYSKAAEGMRRVVDRCRGPELADVRPRALYLAGLYFARDGRPAQAISYYELVEQEFPDHQLADDARLKRALNYFELGVEARFTELLSRMAEDYPRGDMVPDGVFQLALRRMEKGDWSGAASVLERMIALVESVDGKREKEYSGRERYWRARAFMQTGERERGLAELEAIIRELPLSYYMLHAYARMVEQDPFRAKKARDAGLERSREQPFQIQSQPEFDEPGFVRAKELLRVGEIAQATREVDALELANPGTAPEILWGIALLYARAGSAELSHRIARGLLTDWLVHWPDGDWVEAWKLAFPRPYLRLVQREAKKNRIPEYLVYAVMREESAFDPIAQSPAEAYGLMQLIVPTAKLYAVPLGLPYGIASLKVPAINVALGSRALGDLLETFPANPLLAIPGYNAGPRAPRGWLKQRPMVDFDVWVELIPYGETRRYTKRVLASRAAYAWLYHPEERDEAMALPLKLEY